LFVLIFALEFFVRVATMAATLSVFAAASLTDSLNQIAADFQKEGGNKIIFNFAASSFLARQIEEGASADVFISADEERMDALQSKGLIATETRKSRLSNTLVIVVAADSELRVISPSDLMSSRFKHLALADPQTVPAGIYARKYFQQMKLWPVLKEKVIPTDNVRAALSAVESGNVEAGVVYKTDAAISLKVKVAYEISQREGPLISYPVAVLKDAPHPELARSFLKYLNSSQADRVFQRFGFILLN